MLPPLGILSIASFLEQYNYEVHVIDLHAEEITPEQFIMILRDLKPKYVGITVLSAHFIPANYVAHLCKEEVPDCKVIVGGVHAEAAPEQMLRNPSIDAVCRGDGEDTMVEFVSGKSYKDILGLSYRCENTIVHNPPRILNKNLDEYPLPAYHLIDFDHYFPPVGSYRDLPAMNVLQTRGCPGSCAFCNSAKTKLRSRSVERIIGLIKDLRYNYGIRQIYFYDDTFTAAPKAVKEFCEKMIREKVDVKWICYVRGDMFRESIAKLMSRAGCHQVLIGIETGSEKLMKAIGKPIKKEQYKEVVEIAHKNDIEVRASFVVGHEEETSETMEETLQFAKDLDVDYFQANILTPYPGTQMYNEAKAKGLILHEEYERYGQNEVVMKLKNLKAEDVIRFEKYTFHRFFLQPKILMRHLSRLRNWSQLMDLWRVAYVFLIEGFTTHKARSKDLESWLHFDSEAHALKKIAIPAIPRLTYQVRQEAIFN
jgi:radical SAM superfamily enzyme YgiQ (UPF0313 family)